MDFYTAEEREMIQRVSVLPFTPYIELDAGEWTRLARGLQSFHWYQREDSKYPDRRQFYFVGVTWLMKPPTGVDHENDSRPAG